MPKGRCNVCRAKPGLRDFGPFSDIPDSAELLIIAVSKSQLGDGWRAIMDNGKPPLSWSPPASCRAFPLPRAVGAQAVAGRCKAANTPVAVGKYLFWERQLAKYLGSLGRRGARRLETAKAC